MDPCLTPTPATSTARWPAARAAQPAWERMPAIQRARHIRAVVAKLREHKTRLARRIAMDQGKIRPLAEVEIDFTASYTDYLDYMAKRARRGYPSESSS